MTISEFGNLLLFIGMGFIIIFTILYGVRSRWFRYLEGWALMSRSTSLSLISVLTGTVLVWGRWEGIEVVRVFIYFFFMASSIFSVGVLVRRQHLDRIETEEMYRELQLVHEAEGKSVAGLEKPAPPGMIKELRLLIVRWTRPRNPE